MTKNTRFSPEVRQRAVRMVLESQGEYDSQWAAICSIAPKTGCTPETLRVWVGDADDFLDCFIMPAHIVGGTFLG